MIVQSLVESLGIMKIQLKLKYIVLENVLLVRHSLPEYPWAQTHLKLFSLVTQVAPLWQGEEWHMLSTWSHRGPE